MMIFKNEYSVIGSVKNRLEKMMQTEDDCIRNYKLLLNFFHDYYNLNYKYVDETETDEDGNEDKSEEDENENIDDDDENEDTNDEDENEDINDEEHIDTY